MRTTLLLLYVIGQGKLWFSKQTVVIDYLPLLHLIFFWFLLLLITHRPIILRIHASLYTIFNLICQIKC